MRVWKVLDLIDGVAKESRSLECLSLGALLAVLSFLLLSFLPTNIHALGLGQASVKSYIGQPLKVDVPILQIDSTSTVSVLVHAPDFENQNTGLSAVIIDSQGQRLIKVTSLEPVKEPFFGFRLQLSDGQTSFAKEFQVLLDPPPYQQEYELATSLISTPQRTNSASIMGPYDWAQAGNIPKQFGPVLDGQALWRVARRINKAMGVSVEQMMLALYEANPSAFSNGSIGSLQASSVLTIPSESEVKKMSHAQAKAALDEAALEGDLATRKTAKKLQQEPISDSRIQVEIADADTSSSEMAAKGSGKPAAKEVPSFQLSGIGGEGLQTGETNLAAQSAQQAEIIQSLSETVGSLTQELIKKDEQIDNLQEQVNDLKALARLDESLSESALISANTVQATESTQSNEEETSWPAWLWFSIVVSIFGVAAWFLKDSLFRVMARMRRQEQLNELMAQDQQQDQAWNSSIRDTVERIMDEYNKDETTAVSENFADKTEPEIQPKEVEPPSTSSTKDVDQNSELNFGEEESYIVVEDHAHLSGESDSVRMIDLGDEDIDLDLDDDVDGPTFDERFAELLEEGNYEYAKEFLDFSRGTAIDDVDYHCQRLRLLKHQQDEKAFYDYYYLIESKMTSFPFEAQTEISKMVVELSQKS